MIRAILFLCKIALLSFAVVWIAEREGSVRFNWTDTQGADIAVNMHLGLFLLAVLATLLTAMLLFRIIGELVRFPKSWSRYQDFQRRERGFKALTLGLTAVAAGDKKVASYQAYRAEKLLPTQTALGLLLKAQAARLQGREDIANENFMALLENKEGAFLGMRGLLQSALDRKNYGSALMIAREALALHPKQPWILKITYDLEIRQRDLEAALKTLYRLEKAKSIDKQKATSDRIAMLIYQADQASGEGKTENALKFLEKAHGYDPVNIPTITRLAATYLSAGKRKRAENILLKAWKANPHPDLVPLWGKAAPKNKSSSAAALYTWYERLITEEKPSFEGQIALARTAIDCGLWGEARQHLKQVEEIRPTKALYHLMAKLEEKSGRRPDIIQKYLKQAAEAAQDMCWICTETGRVYDRWHAYAMPHGAFNTIVWDLPLSHEHVITLYESLEYTQPTPVIEAPKAG